MKNKLNRVGLIALLVMGVTGCGKSLNAELIGTWNCNDGARILTLSEGNLWSLIASVGTGPGSVTKSSGVYAIEPTGQPYRVRITGINYAPFDKQNYLKSGPVEGVAGNFTSMRGLILYTLNAEPIQCKRM